MLLPPYSSGQYVARKPTNPYQRPNAVYRHIHAVLDLAMRAWTIARNATTSRIDWHFTTADARIKPKRRYPPYDE